MLRAEPVDARRVRLRLLELGRHQVRRPLPDAVEPVDEHGDLGPPRLVGGEERRLREAALEVLDDRRRVGDRLVAVDQHRHERLPADVLDRGPVVRVDVDPLDLEPLVPGRERDALDVRRERDPVDAERHDAIVLAAPQPERPPREGLSGVAPHYGLGTTLLAGTTSGW